MWHSPLELESDPIIVHRLIEVHEPVEDVIANAEEMTVTFKALASSAVSEFWAWSPGQRLQKMSKNNFRRVFFKQKDPSHLHYPDELYREEICPVLCHVSICV